MTAKIPVDRKARFSAWRGALAGLAVVLGACTALPAEAVVTTANLPDDYRQRHPIVIQEAGPVGRHLRRFRRRGGSFRRAARGRCDGGWRNSGCTKEPAPSSPPMYRSNTPNARERAAGRPFREISGDACGGRRAPARDQSFANYHPQDPRQLATIRLNYPKNLGRGPGPWRAVARGSRAFDSTTRTISITGRITNFGCAYQRNMASMVDNPSDLEQPQSENPCLYDEAHGSFRKVPQGVTRPRPSIPRPNGPNSATQANDQATAPSKSRKSSRSPHRRPRTIISLSGTLACRCRPFARRWKPPPPCNRAGEDRRLGKAASEDFRWAAWRPRSRPIVPRPLPT